MDPISVGLGIVGLGMQIFGGISGAGVAGQEAKVSQDIAQQEQGINAQKQMQMQLESRRAQMQNFRNSQRLRAQATAAAVSGGQSVGMGMQSSGYQGGQASIQGTGAENALGINQAVETSQNIFNYNSAISSDKQQLASLGGQAATDQAISGIGGDLLSNSSKIGGIAMDVGKKFGFNIPTF